MTDPADHLRDGLCAGRPAYLVGGGPSLRAFDWGRLRGEFVVAINRAIEKVPWAAVFVTMDSQFLRWHRSQVSAFGGAKLWLDTEPTLRNLPAGVRRVNQVAPGADTWSERIEDGLGHGGHSGYVALNLAYMLGADPIYLLGYDCTGSAEGDQAWWHDGYPITQSASVYHGFRAYLEDGIARCHETAIRRYVPSDARVVPIEGAEDVDTLPAPRAMPRYITAWTPDRYATHAARLAASCRALGIELAERRMWEPGTWVEIAARKAAILSDELQRHPDRGVVWLDADAIVRRYPMLFDVLEAEKKTDIAFARKGRELLSGTIYLGGTDGGVEIARRWAQRCDMEPDRWDQKILADVLACGDFEVYELPPTYTQIYDTMADVGNPVIEHFQASREGRK